MKNKFFGSNRSVYKSLGKGEKLSNKLKFFGAFSAIAIFAIIGGISLHLREATKAASDTPSSADNVFEAKFLPTPLKNDPLDPESSINNNESIVLKTLDNKYVLIDTANSRKALRDKIYNSLFEYQYSSETAPSNATVTIDYLIISHFHGDHVGNAYNLLSNDNFENTSIPRFKVNNIIVKYEKSTDNINQYKFGPLIEDALINNPDVHIYTTENANNYTYEKNGNPVFTITCNEGNFSCLTEGQRLTIGDYLNLYFYNTPDAYDGKVCSTGYQIRFAASSTTATKFNLPNIGEKYVYFDGMDYKEAVESGDWSKFKLKTADSANSKINEENNLTSNAEKALSRYFYAYISSSASFNCNSNGNSLAVFAEITGDTNNKKYAYFPNDLENVGYRITPDPESGIYGSGFGVIYQNPEDFFIPDLNNPNMGTINKSTVPNSIQIPNETIIAEKIRDKFGDTIFKNTTIYQASHHHLNNAPDAINDLELNKPSTYSIATYRTDPTRTGRITFEAVRYSYIALSEANKLYTGNPENEADDSENKNGVNCIIRNNTGLTYCGYETMSNIQKSLLLTYNANNSNNPPVTQICKVDETSCSINISDTTPTRAGYTFLGWANDASATTATYQPGAEITLTADKTIYAVWEKNSTPAPDEDDDEDEDDEFIVVPNTGSSTDTNNSPTHSIINISTITIITASIVVFNIHKRIRNKKNALKF